ncbi:PREDICTED: F-box/kelch-repeat protein SKIP25-like [Camelina sativa]|uniref:F-box/kelch-repeat protein SKIP25-like n=1 Tax=Camelina sativa TaxID=90675 RepID=A0ABM0YED5_CAMSA|nr:PREDICTED: F-box/kelch-repeat protein SKIP25-like [Camelina sativa]
MVTAAAESPPAKRRKTITGNEDSALIEGLPDHISEICLSLVRRPSLLSAVCTRWRRLLYSPEFPPFPSLYALFVGTTSEPGRVNPSVRFMCFDPVSSKWDPLPPPPPDPPLHRILYRHPSFISFNLSIQCVSAAGKLILIAGSNQQLSPAISHPLIFDPNTSSWSSGPQIGSPRRWCATGACDGAIYIASGISSQFSSTVAKSTEKLDLTDQISSNRRFNWEKLRDMRDLRFSREAIDAVGYKSKLLMVNVKGDAIKEGAIYDVVKDEWRAMPEEMLVGWRGPVAAMEEEILYSVDERRGTVRKYDEETREWSEVAVVDGGEELLKGATQVTAVAGKLCVVTVDGKIAVVDVVAEPAMIWSVEVPDGLEPVSVHVLPRMSKPDFC